MKGQVSDMKKEVHGDEHLSVCLSLDVSGDVVFVNGCARKWSRFPNAQVT